MANIEAHTDALMDVLSAASEILKKEDRIANRP